MITGWVSFFFKEKTKLSNYDKFILQANVIGKLANQSELKAQAESINEAQELSDRQGSRRAVQEMEQLQRLLTQVRNNEVGNPKNLGKVGQATLDDLEGKLSDIHSMSSAEIAAVAAEVEKKGKQLGANGAKAIAQQLRQVSDAQVVLERFSFNKSAVENVQKSIESQLSDTVVNVHVRADLTDLNRAEVRLHEIQNKSERVVSQARSESKRAEAEQQATTRELINQRRTEQVHEEARTANRQRTYTEPTGTGATVASYQQRKLEQTRENEMFDQGRVQRSRRKWMEQAITSGNIDPEKARELGLERSDVARYSDYRDSRERTRWLRDNHAGRPVSAERRDELRITPEHVRAYGEEQTWKGVPLREREAAIHRQEILLKSYNDLRGHEELPYKELRSRASRNATYERDGYPVYSEQQQNVLLRRYGRDQASQEHLGNLLRAAERENARYQDFRGSDEDKAILRGRAQRFAEDYDEARKLYDQERAPERVALVRQADLRDYRGATDGTARFKREFFHDSLRTPQEQAKYDEIYEPYYPERDTVRDNKPVAAVPVRTVGRTGDRPVPAKKTNELAKLWADERRAVQWHEMPAGTSFNQGLVERDHQQLVLSEAGEKKFIQDSYRAAVRGEAKVDFNEPDSGSNLYRYRNERVMGFLGNFQNPHGMFMQAAGYNTIQGKSDSYKWEGILESLGVQLRYGRDGNSGIEIRKGSELEGLIRAYPEYATSDKKIQARLRDTSKGVILNSTFKNGDFKGHELSTFLGNYAGRRGGMARSLGLLFDRQSGDSVIPGGLDFRDIAPQFSSTDLQAIGSDAAVLGDDIQRRNVRRLRSYNYAYYEPEETSPLDTEKDRNLSTAQQEYLYATRQYGRSLALISPKAKPKVRRKLKEKAQTELLGSISSLPHFDELLQSSLSREDAGDQAKRQGTEMYATALADYSREGHISKELRTYFAEKLAEESIKLGETRTQQRGGTNLAATIGLEDWQNREHVSRNGVVREGGLISGALEFPKERVKPTLPPVYAPGVNNIVQNIDKMDRYKAAVTKQVSENKELTPGQRKVEIERRVGRYAQRLTEQHQRFLEQPIPIRVRSRSEDGMEHAENADFSGNSAIIGGDSGFNHAPEVDPIKGNIVHLRVNDVLEANQRVISRNMTTAHRLGYYKTAQERESDGTPSQREVLRGIYGEHSAGIITAFNNGVLPAPERKGSRFGDLPNFANWRGDDNGGLPWKRGLSKGEMRAWSTPGFHTYGSISNKLDHDQADFERSITGKDTNFEYGDLTNVVLGMPINEQDGNDANLDGHKTQKLLGTHSEFGASRYHRGFNSAINSFRDEHDFLSNTYRAQVEYEGVKYPSVENAFQAAKFADPSQRVRFQNVTPNRARSLGRNIPAYEMRPDWDTARTSVMATLLRSKFSNPELRAKLEATGSRQIIEGGDTFWGVDRKTQTGRNVLGQMLMDVRGIAPEPYSQERLPFTHKEFTKQAAQLHGPNVAKIVGERYFGADGYDRALADLKEMAGQNGNHDPEQFKAAKYAATTFAQPRGKWRSDGYTTWSQDKATRAFHRNLQFRTETPDGQKNAWREEWYDLPTPDKANRVRAAMAWSNQVRANRIAPTAPRNEWHIASPPSDYEEMWNGFTSEQLNNPESRDQFWVRPLSQRARRSEAARKGAETKRRKKLEAELAAQEPKPQPSAGPAWLSGLGVDPASVQQVKIEDLPPVEQPKSKEKKYFRPHEFPGRTDVLKAPLHWMDQVAVLRNDRPDPFYQAEGAITRQDGAPTSSRPSRRPVSRPRVRVPVAREPLPALDTVLSPEEDHAPRQQDVRAQPNFVHALPSTTGLTNEELQARLDAGLRRIRVSRLAQGTTLPTNNGGALPRVQETVVPPIEDFWSDRTNTNTGAYIPGEIMGRPKTKSNLNVLLTNEGQKDWTGTNWVPTQAAKWPRRNWDLSREQAQERQQAERRAQPFPRTGWDRSRQDNRERKVNAAIERQGEWTRRNWDASKPAPRILDGQQVDSILGDLGPSKRLPIPVDRVNLGSKDYSLGSIISRFKVKPFVQDHDGNGPHLEEAIKNIAQMAQVFESIVPEEQRFKISEGGFGDKWKAGNVPYPKTFTAAPRAKWPAQNGGGYPNTPTPPTPPTPTPPAGTPPNPRPLWPVQAAKKAAAGGTNNQNTPPDPSLYTHEQPWASGSPWVNGELFNNTTTTNQFVQDEVRTALGDINKKRARRVATGGEYVQEVMNIRDFTNAQEKGLFTSAQQGKNVHAVMNQKSVEAAEKYLMGLLGNKNTVEAKKDYSGMGITQEGAFKAIAGTGDLRTALASISQSMHQEVADAAKQIVSNPGQAAQIIRDTKRKIVNNQLVEDAHLPDSTGTIRDKIRNQRELLGLNQSSTDIRAHAGQQTTLNQKGQLESLASRMGITGGYGAFTDASLGMSRDEIARQITGKSTGQIFKMDNMVLPQLGQVVDKVYAELKKSGIASVQFKEALEEASVKARGLAEISGNINNTTSKAQDERRRREIRVGRIVHAEELGVGANYRGVTINERDLDANKKLKAEADKIYNNGQGHFFNDAGEKVTHTQESAFSMARNNLADRMDKSDERMGMAKAGLVNMGAFMGGTLLQQGITTVMTQMQDGSMAQRALQRTFEVEGTMGNNAFAPQASRDNARARTAMASRNLNEQAVRLGATQQDVAKVKNTLFDGGTHSLKEVEDSMKELDRAAQNAGVVLTDMVAIMQTMGSMDISAVDAAKFMGKYEGTQDMSNDQIAAATQKIAANPDALLYSTEEKQQAIVGAAHTPGFVGFAADPAVAAKQFDQLMAKGEKYSNKEAPKLKGGGVEGFVQSMTTVQGLTKEIGALIDNLKDAFTPVVAVVGILLGSLVKLLNIVTGLWNMLGGFGDAITAVASLVGLSVLLYSGFGKAYAAAKDLKTTMMAMAGVEKLLQMIGALGGLGKAFAAVRVAMATMSAQFAATMTAGGGLTAVMGGLATAAGTAAAAVWAALAPLLPVIAAVAAIGAIGYGAYKVAENRKTEKAAEEKNTRRKEEAAQGFEQVKKVASNLPDVSTKSKSELLFQDVGKRIDHRQTQKELNDLNKAGMALGDGPIDIDKTKPIVLGSRSMTQRQEWLLARSMMGDYDSQLGAAGTSKENLIKQYGQFISFGDPEMQQNAKEVRNKKRWIATVRGISTMAQDESEEAGQYYIANQQRRMVHSLGAKLSPLTGKVPGKLQEDIDLGAAKARRDTYENALDRRFKEANIKGVDDLAGKDDKTYAEIMNKRKQQADEIAAAEIKSIQAHADKSLQKVALRDDKVQQLEGQKQVNDESRKGLQLAIDQEMIIARKTGSYSALHALEAEMNKLMVERKKLESDLLEARLAQIDATQKWVDLQTQANKLTPSGTRFILSAQEAGTQGQYTQTKTVSTFVNQELTALRDPNRERKVGDYQRDLKDANKIAELLPIVGRIDSLKTQQGLDLATAKVHQERGGTQADYQEQVKGINARYAPLIAAEQQKFIKQASKLKLSGADGKQVLAGLTDQLGDANLSTSTGFKSREAAIQGVITEQGEQKASARKLTEAQRLYADALKKSTSTVGAATPAEAKQIAIIDNANTQIAGAYATRDSQIEALQNQLQNPRLNKSQRKNLLNQIETAKTDAKTQVVNTTTQARNEVFDGLADGWIKGIDRAVKLPKGRETAETLEQKLGMINGYIRQGQTRVDPRFNTTMEQGRTEAFTSLLDRRMSLQAEKDRLKTERKRAVPDFERQLTSLYGSVTGKVAKGENQAIRMADAIFDNPSLTLADKIKFGVDSNGNIIKGSRLNKISNISAVTNGLTQTSQQFEQDYRLEQVKAGEQGWKIDRNGFAKRAEEEYNKASQQFDKLKGDFPDMASFEHAKSQALSGLLQNVQSSKKTLDDWKKQIEKTSQDIAAAGGKLFGRNHSDQARSAKELYDNVVKSEGRDSQNARDARKVLDDSVNYDYMTNRAKSMKEGWEAEDAKYLEQPGKIDRHARTDLAKRELQGQIAGYEKAYAGLAKSDPKKYREGLAAFTKEARDNYTGAKQEEDSYNEKIEGLKRSARNLGTMLGTSPDDQELQNKVRDLMRDIEKVSGKNSALYKRVEAMQKAARMLDGFNAQSETLKMNMDAQDTNNADSRWKIDYKGRYNQATYEYNQQVQKYEKANKPLLNSGLLTQDAYDRGLAKATEKAAANKSRAKSDMDGNDSKIRSFESNVRSIGSQLTGKNHGSELVQKAVELLESVDGLVDKNSPKYKELQGYVDQAKTYSALESQALTLNTRFETDDAKNVDTKWKIDYQGRYDTADKAYQDQLKKFRDKNWGKVLSGKWTEQEYNQNEATVTKPMRDVREKAKADNDAAKERMESLRKSVSELEHGLSGTSTGDELQTKVKDLMQTAEKNLGKGNPFEKKLQGLLDMAHMLDGFNLQTETLSNQFSADDAKNLQTPWAVDHQARFIQSDALYNQQLADFDLKNAYRLKLDPTDSEYWDQQRYDNERTNATAKSREQRSNQLNAQYQAEDKDQAATQGLRELIASLTGGAVMGVETQERLEKAFKQSTRDWGDEDIRTKTIDGLRKTAPIIDSVLLGTDALKNRNADDDSINQGRRWNINWNERHQDALTTRNNAEMNLLNDENFKQQPPEVRDAIHRALMVSLNGIVDQADSQMRAQLARDRGLGNTLRDAKEQFGLNSTPTGSRTKSLEDTIFNLENSGDYNPNDPKIKELRSLLPRAQIMDSADRALGIAKDDAGLKNVLDQGGNLNSSLEQFRNYFAEVHRSGNVSDEAKSKFKSMSSEIINMANSAKVAGMTLRTELAATLMKNNGEAKRLQFGVGKMDSAGEFKNTQDANIYNAAVATQNFKNGADARRTSFMQTKSLDPNEMLKLLNQFGNDAESRGLINELNNPGGIVTNKMSDGTEFYTYGTDSLRKRVASKAFELQDAAELQTYTNGELGVRQTAQQAWLDQMGSLTPDKGFSSLWGNLTDPDNKRTPAEIIADEIKRVDGFRDLGKNDPTYKEAASSDQGKRVTQDADTYSAVLNGMNNPEAIAAMTNLVAEFRKQETLKTRINGITGTDRDSTELLGKLQGELGQSSSNVTNIAQVLKKFGLSDTVVNSLMNGSVYSGAEAGKREEDRLVTQKSIRDASVSEARTAFQRASRYSTDPALYANYYKTLGESNTSNQINEVDKARSILAEKLLAQARSAFKDKKITQISDLEGLDLNEDMKAQYSYYKKLPTGQAALGMSLTDLAPLVTPDVINNLSNLRQEMVQLGIESQDAAVSLVKYLGDTGRALRDAVQGNASERIATSLAQRDWEGAGRNAALLTADKTASLREQYNAARGTQFGPGDNEALMKAALGDREYSAQAIDIISSRREVDRQISSAAWNASYDDSISKFDRDAARARPKLSTSGAEAYDVRMLQQKLNFQKSQDTTGFTPEQFEKLNSDIRNTTRELEQSSQKMQDHWRGFWSDLASDMMGALKDGLSKSISKALDKIFEIEDERTRQYKMDSRASGIRQVDFQNEADIAQKNADKAQQEADAAKTPEEHASAIRRRDSWLTARDNALSNSRAEGTTQSVLDSNKEIQDAAEKNSIWTTAVQGMKDAFVSRITGEMLDQSIGKLFDTLLNKAAGIEDPQVKAATDLAGKTTTFSTIVNDSQAALKEGIVAAGATYTDAANQMVSAAGTMMQAASAMAAAGSGGGGTGGAGGANDVGGLVGKAAEFVFGSVAGYYGRSHPNAGQPDVPFGVHMGSGVGYNPTPTPVPRLGTGGTSSGGGFGVGGHYNVPNFNSQAVTPSNTTQQPNLTVPTSMKAASTTTTAPKPANNLSTKPLIKSAAGQQLATAGLGIITSKIKFDTGSDLMDYGLGFVKNGLVAGAAGLITGGTAGMATALSSAFGPVGLAIGAVGAGIMVLNKHIANQKQAREFANDNRQLQATGVYNYGLPKNKWVQDSGSETRVNITPQVVINTSDALSSAKTQMEIGQRIAREASVQRLARGVNG